MRRPVPAPRSRWLERAIILIWSAATCARALLDVTLAPVPHIDFLVYRAGAHEFLHRLPVYDGPLPTGLPGFEMYFTDPPFAGLVLSPSVLGSAVQAAAVHTVLCLAALVALVWLVVRRWEGADVWTALAVADACALLRPVTIHLWWGQVGLILILLVAADWLPERPLVPRGLLTGVAIALKLTPAVFLLYPLVCRDRRGLLTAVGSALGCTALGALVFPAQSATFWSSALWSSDHVAKGWEAENQSLHGLFVRLLPHTAATLAWAVASAAVVVVVGGLASAMVRRGDRVMAFGMTTLIAPLVSPVSWAHHWVFVLPLLLELGRRGIVGLRDGRPASHPTELLLGLTGAVLMLLAPVDLDGELLRQGSTQYSVLASVVSGAYVYWALLVLVLGRSLLQEASSPEDRGPAAWRSRSRPTGGTRRRTAGPPTSVAGDVRD